MLSLEKFAIVLDELKKRNAILPLFPIRNFLGISTSRTPNSPSLICYNEGGTDYTGIHKGKTTFSALWGSIPRRAVNWTRDNPMSIAGHVYGVFREFHNPKMPVELVLDAWNTKFGASTGIIFSETDTWDKYLRTNKNFALARQLDGYHLETSGNSIVPKDFEGLKVLLTEFPKLEAIIAKNMEITESQENTIEVDVDLG